MKRYGFEVALFVGVHFIAFGVAIVPGLLRGASSTPDFSGDWVETNPAKGSPLTLRLTQSGSRVEMQLSYGGNFSGRIFGVATLSESGTATLTTGQACSEQFRHAGYNYDDPGKNIYTLSLKPDSGQPTLVFTAETRWNVPCDGHPIGIEHRLRELHRVKNIPANR